MEHLIKINDRSKAGKAFLEIARQLAETTKAVSFVNGGEDDDNFLALSESSLAKDWLSPEDDVWDDWLKERRKA